MSQELGPSDPSLKRSFWYMLDRIDALEEALDEKIESYLRDYTLQKSEPNVRLQALRLFFRYQYFPPTNQNKAFFQIIIDGMLLDPRKPTTSSPFLKHLQYIKLQVNERKPGSEPQTVEWHEATLPEGSSASSAVARIYCDRPCSARVTMLGNDDFWTIRYEAPEVFRRLFPTSPSSLSIDEMVLLIEAYCDVQRLFGDKDRRYIRCDEKLKELFGMDSIPIWNLRQKFLAAIANPGSALAPTPISFDFFLNTSTTDDVNNLNVLYNQHINRVFQNRTEADVLNPYSLEDGVPLMASDGSLFNSRGMASLFNRIGGKVFDIYIQERDDVENLRFLSEIQTASAEYYEHLKKRKRLSMAAELVSRVALNDQHTVNKLDELLLGLDSHIYRNYTDINGVLVQRKDKDLLHLQPPFPSDLITNRNKPHSDTGDKLRCMPSMLHSYGNYLDIADDDYFSSLNPEVSTALEEEKIMQKMLKVSAKAFPAPSERSSVAVKVELSSKVNTVFSTDTSLNMKFEPKTESKK